MNANTKGLLAEHCPGNHTVSVNLSSLHCSSVSSLSTGRKKRLLSSIALWSSYEAYVPITGSFYSWQVTPCWALCTHQPVSHSPVVLPLTTFGRYWPMLTHHRTGLMKTKTCQSHLGPFTSSLGSYTAASEANLTSTKATACTFVF